MNKTLRNKALRDTHRLITCYMNNELWYAPDGYFATAYPIYEGYKVKKSQEIPEGKPLLHKILSSQPYKLATSIKLLQPESSQFDYPVYVINDCIYIQAVYFDLLKNIYPDMTVHVEQSEYRYAPVEIKQNNVLVAVIMPLKG